MCVITDQTPENLMPSLPIVVILYVEEYLMAL